MCASPEGSWKASPVLCRFSEPLKSSVHRFGLLSAFTGVTTSVAFTGIEWEEEGALSLEGLSSSSVSPGVVEISTVTEAFTALDSKSEPGSETRGEAGGAGI